jgi:hypothetical protein
MPMDILVSKGNADVIKKITHHVFFPKICIIYHRLLCRVKNKSIILNNAYVTPSQPIGQVGLKKDWVLIYDGEKFYLFNSHNAWLKYFEG